MESQIQTTEDRSGNSGSTSSESMALQPYMQEERALVPTGPAHELSEEEYQKRIKDVRPAKLGSCIIHQQYSSSYTFLVKAANTLVVAVSLSLPLQP